MSQQGWMKKRKVSSETLQGSSIDVSIERGQMYQCEARVLFSSLNLFYTPQTVIKIVATVVGYNCACGSYSIILNWESTGPHVGTVIPVGGRWGCLAWLVHGVPHLKWLIGGLGTLTQDYSTLRQSSSYPKSGSSAIQPQGTACLLSRNP